MGIQIEGSIVFPTPYPEADGEESLAVANFRRYLRIRTVHPKPDYRSCSVFLRGLAEEIGLDFKEIECVQGKPISILTWKGTDPSLPSIMLNSHTDVVPVFEESWLHDPFSADRVVNSEGETVIIARGSQDMKIVGILYLEAIRELKKSYPQPLRTVHMSFVPDEEIDGSDGMKEFIKTDLFKELNVGLALDEGISNEGGFYRVFYGERSPWKVRYTTTGNTGHGSQFIGDLATDKLFRIAKKLRDFRFTQELILVDNPERTLGDVTTINLTQLQSGVQFNVVPKTAAAVFDIRISPNVNLQEFKATLESFAAEEGADIEFLSYFEGGVNTTISDDFPWWRAFKKGFANSGKEFKLEIFPAATDSRYLRQAGFPAYGVSPLRNTPILLHDHNEYVKESTVAEGLDFYMHLLPELFNMPSEN
ncbi:adenylate cyclase [Entomophthora muscae]|uniref:Adenylate cyclase n=2 Tax=Entomophthora muscae TaxID=34485 RepID=A0ACC2S9N7_9FUNG|nr:adenylate cyclase [Entomophthora muscae]